MREKQRESEARSGTRVAGTVDVGLAGDGQSGCINAVAAGGGGDAKRDGCGADETPHCRMGKHRKTHQAGGHRNDDVRDRVGGC